MTTIHPDAGAVIDTRGRDSKAFKPCSRSSAEPAGSQASREASGSCFNLEAFKTAHDADGKTKSSLTSDGERDDANARDEQSGGNGSDLALQRHPPDGILQQLQVTLLPHAVNAAPSLPPPDEDATPDVEQVPSPDERCVEKCIGSALSQLRAIPPDEPDSLLAEDTARVPADRPVLSLAAWSREETIDDSACYLAHEPKFPVGQLGAATGGSISAAGSAAVLAGEQPAAPAPAHLRQTVTGDPQAPLRRDTISALPHRTSPDLTSLRMTLSPSDLGTVDMLVRRRGSKLEIRLITETEGAALAITGGRASLDAALASQGVGMTTGNVEVVSRADTSAHEQSPADAMLQPESGSAGGRGRQKSHEGTGTPVERQPALESRPLQVWNGAEHDTSILQERGRSSFASWRIV